MKTANDKSINNRSTNQVLFDSFDHLIGLCDPDDNLSSINATCRDILIKLIELTGDNPFPAESWLLDKGAA